MKNKNDIKKKRKYDITKNQIQDLQFLKQNSECSEF